MSRSAYVAKVDPDELRRLWPLRGILSRRARCKLGQKLCTKDGPHRVYPQQELPDEVKWGPEKWADRLPR
jgi:hypothetical protein